MDSDASIGVLGGRGIAVSDIELPYWFTTYQTGYAVGVQNKNSGIVDDRGYLWGAGMIMRREDISALFSAGFKSVLTGRVGSQLSSGDDSEICKWFLLIGKSLYYTEELIYVHYIEQKRLNKEYLLKLFEGHNQSIKILAIYNIYIFYYMQNNNKFSKKKRIGKLLYYLFSNKINRNALLECYNTTSIVFCHETRYLKRCLRVYHENVSN